MGHKMGGVKTDYNSIAPDWMRVDGAWTWAVVVEMERNG